MTAHLSDPVLDEPKGAAGALHGVLSFLQGHATLAQVPHHVLHLALHGVCPAPGADRAEGRECVDRNEEASGSTHSIVQENVPPKPRQGRTNSVAFPCHAPTQQTGRMGG